MKSINELKEKSVLGSSAGSTLKTISVIVLIVGIISSVILLVLCCEEYSWTAFPSAVGTLFGSIFVYALGKTIAKIADYMEAIYKQVNPDIHLDGVLAGNSDVFPGDLVYNKKDENKTPIKITRVTYDGYLRYYFINEKGEEDFLYASNVEKISEHDNGK